MTVQCEPQQNSPRNTPVFRPGSGASGSIHGSSSAIATSLQSVHSLKDLVSLKGSGSHDTDGTEKSSGKPLLSLDHAVGVATVALALCSCAAIPMMHRPHHGHGHHNSDGPRQPGTSHIPPHHIGKGPPFFDPRFEHKYSFRQYMRDMQHWVLITDLPPHQQSVMILKNLGGAAYDLISQLSPPELYSGATVSGVHLDPTTNILLKLHHRFAQHDMITRMSAMSEMLSFRRYNGEGIQTVSYTHLTLPTIYSV